MRLVIILTIIIIMQVDCQLWSSPKDFFNNFSWFRQPKMGLGTSSLTNNSATTTLPTTIDLGSLTTTKQSTTKQTIKQPLVVTTLNDNLNQVDTTLEPGVTKFKKNNINWTTTIITTTDKMLDTTMSTMDDGSTTTLESRDNPRVNQYFPNKREKPQVKIVANISQNLLPLPAGAGAALVKPTKYHYYPHNQHIYLLPECAIQQVCNAVYVRLNWTQPLCACPSRYRDPCSASLNSDDLHTTELIIDPNAKKALTLVKTCEPTADMRLCRSPRDWSLLALQNIRTGKSHYLVICRCSDNSILEGPMSHDQPTYASVPGIRVYGMMCVQGRRRGRPFRVQRSMETDPPIPWHKVQQLADTADWD